MTNQEICYPTLESADVLSCNNADTNAAEIRQAADCNFEFAIRHLFEIIFSFQISKPFFDEARGLTSTPVGFNLEGSYYTRTVSASRDNTVRNGNDLDLVYVETVEKD